MNRKDYDPQIAHIDCIYCIK